LVNSILFIPCLLVYTIDFLVKILSSEKAVGNKTELILLGLGLFLVLLYFIVPLIENFFVLQGGKQIINDPVSINGQRGAADYMQLYDLDPKHMPNPVVYDYNYGISFWFYLDSYPTSKDKYITIFNYGDQPRVLYKCSNNTMMVTSAPNNIPNSSTSSSNPTQPGLNLEDIDSKGNVIVYTRKNMQLQKWNNLIFNYSGGTLDIFYNGELVKSAENIVPYMTMQGITVGENDGLHGGICNLVFFKNSLTSQKIKALYSSVKDKTPPTLYNSTKSLTFAQ
jgi:hypothetical protein